MAVTITNDAATTRTNLGLGDAATKTVGTSAGNIPVLDGSGKLPAVSGENLTGIVALPSQSGHNGKFLTTDATDASWATSPSPSNVTSNAFDFGNWTITETAGVLYFATGGTNKMKLDASGNLICVGNVTAYGSI